MALLGHKCHIVTAPPSSSQPHRPCKHMHGHLLVSTRHILIMTIILKYYVIFKMLHTHTHTLGPYVPRLISILACTVLYIHTLITFKRMVSCGHMSRSHVRKHPEAPTCACVLSRTHVHTSHIFSDMFGYKYTFPHTRSPPLRHPPTHIFYTSVHTAV